MSIKKRGLGRGLDALLSQSVTGNVKKEATKLPIDLLQRGKYQPRTEFDQIQLQELADSISAQGIIQPIVVRPVGANSYEILAGERRWRAAQLAGLEDVDVVINDVDDRSAIAISLIENIQRENLNILDESEALQRLINEFEMTHQQGADAVGRSRAAVSNLLRLLELGQEAKESLRAGKIEMGHGRALLALSESQQSSVVSKVVAGGLSVRATEAMVKRVLKSGGEKKSTLVKDPDVERLEQDIAEKLGANVKISHSSKGDGKIVIQFSSLNELEGVLGHFK
jgi:ParB family transcriptional regulator, chromosome partitioning protein